MKKALSLALALLLTASLTAPAAMAAEGDGLFKTSMSKLEVPYDLETRPKSTDRYASTVKASLIVNGDGTISALRAPVRYEGGDAVRIDTYSDELVLKETRFIPLELPIFGGFFAGETYNYIAYGQKNMEEDDAKEVIRLVKYDKNFERVSAAAVRGCFTTIPFDAGSLRMAENGDELVMHTSRQRYKTEDGLYHQSQLTVYFDTGRMTVTSKELGRYQPNHVSHSFNQFVLFDEDRAVLIDHGDAYPRALVMHREKQNQTYEETELLPIPGETGANRTGVGVGDFALTDSSYLTAINTIDHSKAGAYGEYSIEGMEQEERDAAILTLDRKGGSVQTTWLTHLSGTGRTASAPKLAALGDDRFMALWETYSYEGAGYERMEGEGLSYAVLDGGGQLVSEIAYVPGAALSDCQPVLWNNCVTWFVDRSDGSGYSSCVREFYQLELTDASRRMILTIDSKSANVFGEEKENDVAPVIVNDRTMLPARFVAENLGAKVGWDPEERKVTILGANGEEILLYVDSETAYVNGEAVTLDSPAVIRNDRTYTPVRFVAEALGARVRWFGGERRVLITK